MPSACGIACEVCGIREKGFCPSDGCVPGTDQKAPEKIEMFTRAMLNYVGGTIWLSTTI